MKLIKRSLVFVFLSVLLVGFTSSPVTPYGGDDDYPEPLRITA